MENGKKKWLPALALSLSAVVVSILCVWAVFRPCTNYSESVILDNGGAVIGESESIDDVVSLKSTKIAVENYDDYNVSPLAETAYVINAQIQPESFAAETFVSWALTFSNPDSVWATGKDVSDYVVCEVSGENAVESQSVVLSCLSAFGEQIILTASATMDEEYRSATCTIDYRQKVQSASLFIGDIDVSSNDDLFVYFAPVYYYETSTKHGSGGVVSFGSVMSDVYTVAENLEFNAAFTLNTYFSDMETYDGNPCFSYKGADRAVVELKDGMSFYFDTNTSPFKNISYSSRSGSIDFSNQGYDDSGTLTLYSCVRDFYSVTRPLGTLLVHITGISFDVTYTVDVYARDEISFSLSENVVEF